VTVHVVLDPHDGELDVPLVIARQIVLDGPLLDLFDLAIWTTVAVLPVTIPLPEKSLVFGGCGASIPAGRVPPWSA
jgi:hypothetical protein